MCIRDRYYVKEKATVNGFVLDNEAREIDLTSVSYTHLKKIKKFAKEGW